jgi:hypothetical protein
MGLFSRLAGTMSQFFQIGGPGGAGWANVGASAIEAKDPTNTTDVNVRGAAPLVPNDLVTKQYDDTAFKPIIVTAQFNGNNPLPANTAVEHFYVVTTTGPNGAIGDLVWDNGTAAGTATLIVAPTGGEIIPTVALAGGTISFSAFQNYAWGGASWIEITGAGTPGAAQVILIAVAQATVSSVTSIPTGATVIRASLLVTTPYPAGTTIEVGQVGNPASLMTTADNDPQVAGTYDAPQVTTWGGAAPVTVTVIGAPAVGASAVMVEYSVPNP